MSLKLFALLAAVSVALAVEVHDGVESHGDGPHSFSKTVTDENGNTAKIWGSSNSNGDGSSSSSSSSSFSSSNGGGVGDGGQAIADAIAAGQKFAEEGGRAASEAIQFGQKAFGEGLKPFEDIGKKFGFGGVFGNRQD